MSPWAPFDFTFEIANNSLAVAYNIVMTFSSEDFVPLRGGVYTLNDLVLGSPVGIPYHFVSAIIALGNILV